MGNSLPAKLLGTLIMVLLLFGSGSLLLSSESSPWIAESSPRWYFKRSSNKSSIARAESHGFEVDLKEMRFQSLRRLPLTPTPPRVNRGHSYYFAAPPSQNCFAAPPPENYFAAPPRQITL